MKNVIISDPERVKSSIRREFSPLRQRYPDLKNDLDLAEANLINSVEEETTIVIVDSLTRQRFMYFLAGYLSLTDERKAFYLFHAVTLVLAIDEVNTLVKKKFGTTYAAFRQRLDTYNIILSKVKFHLDQLDDKTLKAGDTQSDLYRAAMDWLSKLPLIYQELDAVFVLICRYTNLGQNTVPQQAISMFQQEFKRVSYSEDRRQRDASIDDRS